MKKKWEGIAIYDKKKKDIVRLPASVFFAFMGKLKRNRFKIIKVSITPSRSKK